MLDNPRLSSMDQVSLWELAAIVPGVFDGHRLRSLLTELARPCPKV
jgi:hypothetical protein